MKISYLLLLLCFLTLAACHPGKTIFIRNQTDRPIKVVLNHPGTNPFFNTPQSVFYLRTKKHERDTIVNYGKGNRWTDAEKDALTKMFNDGIIVFTDHGDTLKTKRISVQNIGLNVNELYLRINK